MPLQFTYSEQCHYNSFEPSNMPFYTYLILLDPRAGSGIFVWTKMPLLPLHPPLTYLWAPHVSFFFFPSPAAVAALHPQALARTPRPCARAAAASSEVEKTAVVGAAPAPESPPASRARWPSSGGGACELPRQRRRAPRPRRSGSTPALHRAVRGPRPSTASSIASAPPPRRAAPSSPMRSPSSQIRTRSPAPRPRARRRCGHARSSLRRSRPPRAEEGESGGRAEEGGAGGEALVEEGGGSRHAEGGLTGVGEVEGPGSPPHEAGAGAGVGMKKSRGRRRMEGGRG